MISIDASSLILLAKASLLEKILESDQFLIGPQVYEECVTKGKGRGEQDALLIEHLAKAGKLTTTVPQPPIRKQLEHTFGIIGGENETIALAIQEKCRLVVIDDKKGMTACTILNIPFMISLDVILDLYDNKKISVAQAHEAMDKIKRFGWIRDDIIESRERRLERR